MAGRHASKHGPTIGARHLSWQVDMLANQEATIGARHLSRRVGMLANMGPYIGADYRCQPPVAVPGTCCRKSTC